ncbi:hypothetical protein SAMD00019534_009300 [Acytostelium subglobosum LB1]|uniref:hypothetical protein n=1 Tax=Acytostelium subglobosum LB1 TaxID=1410327 RepID=UPI000644D729|nr:hypothetical protein SAMD00019534_009300 [Acytostelium subglobosum LB1]GAM17755.1 hypothetical protein SAMD00019534_009300 [Acytostelium subglobosum LB1]|eukprot:XP_012758351.1 hypothetical protein SAMD00019534_009300 [Acytostelium subglobosum LB1]
MKYNNNNNSSPWESPCLESNEDEYACQVLTLFKDKDTSSPPQIVPKKQYHQHQHPSPPTPTSTKIPTIELIMACGEQAFRRSTNSMSSVPNSSSSSSSSPTKLNQSFPYVPTHPFQSPDKFSVHSLLEDEDEDDPFSSPHHAMLATASHQSHGHSHSLNNSLSCVPRGQSIDEEDDEVNIILSSASSTYSRSSSPAAKSSSMDYNSHPRSPLAAVAGTPGHPNMSPPAKKQKTASPHRHQPPVVNQPCIFNNNCILCKKGKPAILERNPTWAAIMKVVFYTLSDAIPEKAFFSLKSDVYSFMTSHWDQLGLDKKKSNNWHKQIQDMLSHSKNVFESGSDVLGQNGFWRLKYNVDPFTESAKMSDIPTMDESCPNVNNVPNGLSSSSSTLPSSCKSSLSPEKSSSSSSSMSSSMSSINLHHPYRKQPKQQQQHMGHHNTSIKSSPLPSVGTANIDLPWGLTMSDIDLHHFAQTSSSSHHNNNMLPKFKDIVSILNE